MSVISSVLSHLNKNFKRQTLKPSVRHSSWTDHVVALCSRTDHGIVVREISVTAPCYNSVLLRKYQETTSSRCEGMLTQRCEEKREKERACACRRESPQRFGSSFCTFLPPPVNWASEECCLFYLRSSLCSSELPLFYFHGSSLPCLVASAILDSCFLF